MSTTADGNGITLKEPELRVGSATGLTGLAWELFIRAAPRGARRPAGSRRAARRVEGSLVQPGRGDGRVHDICCNGSGGQDMVDLVIQARNDHP